MAKKITEEEVLGKATESQETVESAPVEETPVAEAPVEKPKSKKSEKDSSEEELVTIFIPRRPDEKEDAYEDLYVNGEHLRVQKDVEIKVPARFAEVWRNTKVPKDTKVAEMEAKAKSKVLSA